MTSDIRTCKLLIFENAGSRGRQEHKVSSVSHEANSAPWCITTSAGDCLASLGKCFGDQTLPRATTFGCFGELESDRASFEDCYHSYWPTSSMTPETCESKEAVANQRWFRNHKDGHSWQFGKIESAWSYFADHSGITAKIDCITIPLVPTPQLQLYNIWANMACRRCHVPPLFPIKTTTCFHTNKKGCIWYISIRVMMKILEFCLRAFSTIRETTWAEKLNNIYWAREITGIWQMKQY